jgi:hypothetical protein
MRTAGWLWMALCMTTSLYASESLETQLRSAIKAADSGRYSKFLQQLEHSLQRSWTIQVVAPWQNVPPDVVRDATLREIARRLAAAPEKACQESQQLSWRFFAKSVMSNSNDAFIHHSTLYACWLTLRTHLKDMPSRKPIWESFERHFRGYRARLKQLREQYGGTIPHEKLQKLGKERLRELRIIVQRFQL